MRMAAASCKFDDGPSYPTKCFPARTLLHQRKEGAGHWLVAYRVEERQKCRNLRRRIKETYRKSENDRLSDKPRHGNTLDGPLLLRLHCVDKPSELCSVDISEQKLNSVKSEDLKVFDNVAYVDASINSLSLESFSSFVSLRELNMSLNGLRNIMFDPEDFPHLEVLDLSYNSLSAHEIVSIGRLPRLKVLHLTGNQLHHLPNLGVSSYDATQLPAKEEDTQFKALEVLMLDDNKLSSGVFNCLTNLKRLKYLNLQRNHISEIPSLQLTGGSQPLQTSLEEEAEREEFASTEPNPGTNEHVKRISQILKRYFGLFELGLYEVFIKGRSITYSRCQSTHPQFGEAVMSTSPQVKKYAVADKIFHMENLEEFCKGSSLPLPELQFLNLADNKIVEEEALMTVALFPMLREIDIRSNPLTTQRSGDPPLLTHYLQERLGITIKHKKTQEAVKLPLKVSTDPKWKVEERIPKVSKKSQLMDAPCPAQAQRSELTVKRIQESEGKNSGDDTLQENTQHFFVTQVTDVPEYEFDPQAEEEETAQNKEDDTVPAKFTGYEMLLEAKPNPDMEPVGIQTAVRMLEHTLKNLNVYRDSKPKLDCIQTPYREREKKIKELPPLKPIKQPAERVDEMIKEIKGSTSIREVSISSAIHSTAVNKREALSLLRDMKTKYKMVYEKTMEQAASIESDRNTDRNVAETQPEQNL